MKISHNNHSYLSPSKLSSLGSVKTSVLSPTNSDDTYTTTDLDKLIIDKSASRTVNCNEDETNDNILSSPTYTTEIKSPYRDFSLTSYDNSISYTQYNGLNDSEDALKTPKSATSFRFSDYSSDAPSTPRSRTASIATVLKPTTPDYSMKDFTQLNRIQNLDDLFSYAATNTTTTATTTSSTLNSWNEANCEFTRKEIVQSTTNSTRKPLLSTQNRFLSLSISPPLSRRQDMPVLRGTFVSLYVVEWLF